MKSLATLKRTMKESARNGNGNIAMLCAIKIAQIEHGLGVQTDLFNKQDRKLEDIGSKCTNLHLQSNKEIGS